MNSEPDVFIEEMIDLSRVKTSRCPYGFRGADVFAYCVLTDDPSILPFMENAYTDAELGVLADHVRDCEVCGRVYNDFTSAKNDILGIKRDTIH
ncbi:MAG TPA: hypothetical protein VJB05_03700 [archaeon]|nr:hypothetical protein [archaeon]